MISVETTVRVLYADTDLSGIAYNANYLVWFERARGEFFWQRGMDYVRDVEARGFNWPVTEAQLRYHAPAFYGDILTIRAWVAEVKSRALTIRYEISRKGARICTGFTTHINVNREGHPVAFPDDIRAWLTGAG